MIIPGLGCLTVTAAGQGCQGARTRLEPAKLSRLGKYLNTTRQNFQNPPENTCGWPDKKTTWERWVRQPTHDLSPPNPTQLGIIINKHSTFQIKPLSLPGEEGGREERVEMPLLCPFQTSPISQILLRWQNIQIYKYTNTQILLRWFKYTNIQINQYCLIPPKLPISQIYFWGDTSALAINLLQANY